MTEKKQQPTATEFSIQRLYVKDVSFESPNSPEIFLKDWQPDVHVDLNVATNKLTEDDHEVVLRTTVSVKAGDKTAFLVEVNYAGVFMVKGVTDAEQLRALLGIACPDILFPYARELVSELITRGGFPPLYLAPMNFEALYQQKLAEEQKKKKD